jgi:hypothetical protein
MKRCRRFTDSPSVALLTGREHSAEFEEAVRAINEALAATKFSLRIVVPGASDAQIKCFYAADFAQYTSIRQSYWLQTPPDNWTWDFSWDQNSGLTKGFALITIQGLGAETIRYRTIRALLGTIGLNGWSSAVRDSIFSWQRQSLTATDRKLINFFYGHVQPNAQAYELRQAFDRFWKE